MDKPEPKSKPKKKKHTPNLTFRSTPIPENISVIKKRHTSNLTFLNTQILSNQKDLLDRYARHLGRSRGWLVRQALNNLFNEYTQMGVALPEKEEGTGDESQSP